MKNEHSAEVLAALKKSGWYLGRTVCTKEHENYGMPLFPEAKKVLAEFGGLHVGECGRGIECARSDVRIDPSVTRFFLNDLKAYSSKFGRLFFGIGKCHNEHEYLLIDERGYIYGEFDDFIPIAKSFDCALEILLRGLNRIDPNEML